MAQGLLLPLLLVVVLIIETQCKKDIEAPAHRAYSNSITRKLIAKREIKCKQDEYNLDAQCCKKCERGFVKNISCPTDTSKHCVPCEAGKEYMTHVNDAEKCQRCSSCDSQLGFEVAKKCTPVQNTKCTCAKNHFCNSVSSECDQCSACTICEHGIIEKQCTSTSDTVCGTKGVPWLWAILVIVLVLLALPGAIFLYKRKQKDLTSKDTPGKVASNQDAAYENVPLIYPDVDLSSHIAGIVEEMSFQDVKTFVRNHKVPESVIDETLRDHCNDTSEQKIKLFQVWYQRHGLKGAYETLIKSLRALKMCTAADKIEQKLKAAVSSCQARRQSSSDDTEQSKTCAQEGALTVMVLS